LFPKEPVYAEGQETAFAPPVKKPEYSADELGALLKELDEDEHLWVSAAFSKPGMHTYIVEYEDEDAILDQDTSMKRLQLINRFTSLDTAGVDLIKGNNHEALENKEYSMHRCLVPAREEEIAPFAKEPRSKENVRVFKKEHSVFAQWREDTPIILSNCFKADTEKWKLSRFIKDPKDLENVERVLWDNFVKIKRIFLAKAARSNFPTINWISFTEYCSQCQVVDDKGVRLDTVDRAFIATNVELEKHEENPAAALQRYEFMEIIVRLADSKYKGTGVCATYAESVQKILSDHFLKLGDFTSEWQEFRDKELWTIDVNDVLEANLDLLDKCYKKYMAPRKLLMTLKDALKFMMKDTALNLIEKDAYYCYGMCKMTVEQEIS